LQLCFFLLSVFIAYKTYTIWKAGHIRNLRGVCHYCIFGCTLLRFLYFAIDPLEQTRDIPYFWTELICAYGYFFLYISFLVVVLYWASMYHGFSTNRAKKGKLLQKNAKYVFIVLAVILFAVELIWSVVYGLDFLSAVKDPIVSILYQAHLALITLMVGGGMLIYGTLVYRKLRKSSKQFGTDMTRIKKLTITTLVIAATFIVGFFIGLVILAGSTLYTPIGAVWGFTVIHGFELIACVEMMYLMSKSKHSRTQRLSQRQSTNVAVPLETKPTTGKQEDESEKQYEFSEKQDSDSNEKQDSPSDA